MNQFVECTQELLAVFQLITRVMSETAIPVAAAGCKEGIGVDDNEGITPLVRCYVFQCWYLPGTRQSSKITCVLQDSSSLSSLFSPMLCPELG